MSHINQRCLHLSYKTKASENMACLSPDPGRTDWLFHSLFREGKPLLPPSLQGPHILLLYDSFPLRTSRKTDLCSCTHPLHPSIPQSRDRESFALVANWVGACTVIKTHLHLNLHLHVTGQRKVGFPIITI